MKRFPKTIRNFGMADGVLDESRLLVAFKRDTRYEEVQIRSRALNLKLEGDEPQPGNKHWAQVNNTRRRYWLRSIDGAPIVEEEFARIEKELGGETDWIGPVYRHRTEQGRLEHCCPLPSVLLYRKSSGDDINKIADAFGLKINTLKSRYSSRFHYLEIADVEKANAYEIRDRLGKPFKDVLFESMPMFTPLAATIPNDALWASQWNLARINAPDGWDISTGSSGVVICILDTGCDLSHPDLQISEPGINLEP